MSRTPENLALGQLTATTLTEIYVSPTGTNTTISSLAFTNTTSTDHSIDVYRNDGSTDYLVKTLTLPGGSGRKSIYYGLQGTTSNSGDSIKIQSNSAQAFNYELDGSKVTV